MLILLSLFPSLILKRKQRAANILFFSFFVDYVIISAVKCYLGEGDSTLFESFWDISEKTLFHYGLPLLVTNFGITILLYSKKVSALCADLLGVFNAVLLLLIMMGLFYAGHISNHIMTVLYVLSLFISVVLTYMCKINIEYCTRHEYKTEIKKQGIFVIFFVMLFGVYFPNELFLTNTLEFYQPYWQYLLITILGSIAIGCFLFHIIFCMIPKTWIKIVYLGCFAISIISYIQGMFMNGPMNDLDGQEQIWSLQRIIINTVFWIILLSIILFVGMKNEKIHNVFRKMSLFFIVLLSVTLVPLVIQADWKAIDRTAEMTRKADTKIAKGQNIFVFVLDRFDSGVLEKLREKESVFFEPLQDFTFYRNTTCQFSRTARAIPYLLTGTKWDESYGWEYPEIAYKKSDFLQNLINAEYSLGLYTDKAYIDEAIAEQAVNYEEKVTFHYYITNTIKTTWKTSGYKALPFICKNNFLYSKNDILSMVDMRDTWNIDNDLPFYKDVHGQDITINENYENSFKFFHMHGAHDPFILNEDFQLDNTGRQVTLYGQAKASLKIVYEYMEKLKKIGKYEDSLIIITSDHGDHGQFIDGDGKLVEFDRTPNPIMLVKMPYDFHEKIQVNDIAVTQEQIHATILDVCDISTDEYGKSFTEVTEEDYPNRSNVIMYNNVIAEYIISGNANDYQSWTLKKR